MKAILISIGNELLFGETVDTNSAWIAQRLTASGVEIIEKYTLADDRGSIADTLRTTMQKADFAVATGGLGPTNDDITRHAIADAFEVPLSHNLQTEKNLRDFFKERGRTFSKTNLIQAYIPQRAKIIANPKGTAPGIWMTGKKFNLFALPGVPREMKCMTEQTILPWVCNKKQGKTIKHRVIRTCGIGESSLFGLLQNKYMPNHVKTAYLPEPSGVNIRITAGPGSAKDVGQYLLAAEKQLVALLQDYVYGYDDDSLAQVVGQVLSTKGLTLAVAESCTGGMLGEMITAMPGCSQYFLGGAITYSNESKTSGLGIAFDVLSQYGAVSIPVVESMAQNIRDKLGADYGIGITGIAGPEGGTPEKPVGTVCIAVASPGKTMSERNQFGGDRHVVRLRSVTRALYLLLKDVQ